MAECEWCGGPRAPRQKATCSAKCRGARWRWLKGIGDPPDAPPWPGSPLHGRMGEESRSNTGQVGVVATPGPRSGVNARSGLQVSHAKAVRRVAELLRVNGWLDERTSQRVAEATIAAALSSKQRDRLEARER
jgi:hypothetical protein